MGIFIFLFGLIIGSFLNALIWRLPKGISLIKGRSECPGCHHILGALDLIPVFSFIFLKGKCRFCRAKISWQYPAVELCTATLFSLNYALSNEFLSLNNIAPGEIITQLFNFFFISVLIATFVTDLRWGLIFDAIMYPGIIAAILVQLINPLTHQLINFSMAALIGAGVFAFQYLISKGKWIGSGDIILGGFLGLVLGWPKILIALYLAYVSGALTALLLMSLGIKKIKDTLPLGCFLAAAGIILIILEGARLVSLLE
jgi:prepilin signal peptidase PulO-like enzyme (type II secretory pathway)